MISSMCTTWRRAPALKRLASLTLVLAAALALRMLAALAVQWYVERNDVARLCVFPDARYYWLLARTIRLGAPYEIVEWGNIAHRALRTPGYPLFLAACQACFGERPLAVRLVQAVLGTVSVWLVYSLTGQIIAKSVDEESIRYGRQNAPLVAAALTALNPYYVAMSELILSEALFTPLMLICLWCLAVLWRSVEQPSGTASRLATGRAGLVALAAGVSGGAAILTRPSWGLFLPAVLLIWVIACTVRPDHRRRGAAFRGAVLVLTGVVLVMSPWWIRNARIYGRFVPTALWTGASLYDGLNPRATGASDMNFRADPEFRPLDEISQDAALTRRALEFARSQPRRVLELTVIKFCRYWSPWPNATEYRSPAAAVASAILVVPLYLLILFGAWTGRRDLEALLLLAGPVLYFCAVHSVFVSSIRYRIPGEPAAMGLAAIGLTSIAARVVAARRATRL
jgi:4-amino-4-deoxy-L-arabinose transferase-like glycosyltransferase